MNDTFLNTLLEMSEKEKQDEWRPPSAQQQRPSSVLFSRPPSSILVSRPPSAAYFSRPHSSTTRKIRRPPSTSTLRPRPPSGGPIVSRPPSVSTIGRPTSSLTFRRANSLKCNVCSEGFKFSGSVPCFDSFCAQCLEDHVLNFKRGTGCDCPLCKCAILLPKSGQRSHSAKVTTRSDLTVCNVCQESRLAQYRCNNCEDYFCEKCNKDFLRRMRIDSNFNMTHLADLSGDNSVPVIMAGGMDNESLDSISLNLPSILPKGFGLRCQVHEQEELRFFCTECDQPVCRDCKIINHEGHKTRALEDIYDDRKQHLAQSIKLSNANIRKLHGECAEINSKMLEIDQESRDAIALIENHANQVKKMLDEVSKIMIKEIRTKNTESKGTLQKCRDRVKEKVKVLQDLVEVASDLIESEDGIDVVNKAPPLVSQLTDADVAPTAERLWRKKYVFQKVELTETNIRQLFGRLHTIIEGLLKEIPNVELEMHGTFNSDQSYKQTTALAPLSDNTAWVCNGFKNRIQRFDADGQMVHSETLDFDVDDMVDGRADTLFLTEFNGRVIRKLSNHKLTIFARTDIYLRGITISRDDEFVIVCGNDVPVACLRETAVSKIYVFNMHGKQVREIVVNTGSKGISLFRICHTINDEYVVSTGISGLYYIISENGDIKYRYQASRTADGVATDEHGLIYLSACKDDTLYLLDCKGVPIPSTYAMHKPTAVAIDRQDLIWVGDWSKVHVLKYKI